MGKLKKIIKKFFRDDYDIQHRLLNVILLVGMLGIAISFISNFIFNLDIRITILTGICLLLFILAFILANKLHKPQMAVIILSLLANNLVLPALYITNGGIESGMPIWMLMALIFSLMLIKGKKSFIILGINLIGVVSVIVYCYKNPQAVIHLPTEFNVIVDVMTAILLVTSVFTAIFKYQSYVYENQRKEIQIASTQAKEAALSKGKFLSSMSHDIRTPINSVIGFTKIAKNNIDDKERLLDCLNKTELASDILREIVEEVLFMSQVESGKDFGGEEVCGISEIIDDVLQIIEPQADEKKIKINLDLAMIDDDQVSCKKYYIHQVLLNLLSNAVKYSRPGKNVCLTVIQLTGQDEYTTEFEFHVKDEGCGISEDFIPRLYEPFEKENNIENRYSRGTGLGLALTKSIVTMLNGTISVESQVDKGSEFTVSIPFNVPSLSEIKDDDERVNFDLNGKRVLVVDDNDLNREITVEILKNAGVLVEESRDGSVAIERISISQPGYYDLILMDLQMPGIDGYEATKIIKNLDDRRLSSIPVIALTAYAFPEDKKHAFECGVSAYLTKPINIDDLIKVMKLILQDDSHLK